MSDEMLTEITAKNGVTEVKRTQDPTAILDHNRACLNEAPTWRPYASGRRDVPMRRVAEIPLIVAEQWLKEGFNIFSADPDMQRKLREKLNDPDYAYLRTYPGKVRVGEASMNYAPPKVDK